MLELKKKDKDECTEKSIYVFIDRPATNIYEAKGKNNLEAQSPCLFCSHSGLHPTQ